MNSSGDHRETSRSKGRASTASAPASVSKAARSSTEVSITGACSGRSTAIGWGSKVTATSVRSCASATARARDTTRWWPRWTPSKLPITTAVRPRSAGTSSSERQICTRADYRRVSDEDGDGPRLPVSGLVQREELPRRVEQCRQPVERQVEGTPEADVGGLLVGQVERGEARAGRVGDRHRL